LAAQASNLPLGEQEDSAVLDDRQNVMKVIANPS
jgi:hypothetical protein